MQAAGIDVGPYLTGWRWEVAGVAMVRIATHQAARSEETLSANIGAISGSPSALAERADALWVQREGVDVYELRHRIDEGFPEHLTPSSRLGRASRSPTACKPTRT
ncbi:MAG: hypothetical protein R2991_03485 [Thermoanaerobaculia bacterium]